MKLTQLAVIAATLVFTGCSDMVSLHPFVAETEAVVDNRLNGVWFDTDDIYRSITLVSVSRNVPTRSAILKRWSDTSRK